MVIVEKLEQEQYDRSTKLIEDFKEVLEESKAYIDESIKTFIEEVKKEDKVDFALVNNYLTNKKKFNAMLKRRLKDNYYMHQDEVIKEIERILALPKVKRYEALLYDIQFELDKLYSEGQQMMLEGLKREVIEAQLYTQYEVQKDVMAVWTFNKYDSAIVKTILAKKNMGKLWSERIWGEHREKTMNSIKRQIAVSLGLGESNKTTAKTLAKKFDVALSDMQRVVRTEMSFYMNESIAETYNRVGVEEYMYLATLDNRTSEQCRALDGKIFTLAEKVQGINYPPLHPNCRSTTKAIINGKKPRHRIMKDNNGKNVIGEFMTYEEWKKKYPQNKA